MKIRLLSLLVLNFSVAVFAQDRPIGINLSGLSYYNTELVFCDVFKQGSQWISFQDGGAWSSGVDVPLADNGYPIEIPYNNGIDPPQLVRSLMLWSNNSGDFPAGRYRLIVEGQGKVRLRFGANVIFDAPVDTMVEVNGKLSIEIMESVAENPISDIKLILPNHVNDYADRTFNEDFLTFLNDFDTVRFMDWLKTNNSLNALWTDRAKREYYNQTTSKGVSWEYIVELCNTAGVDPWINIPHLVDDDYIQELATFFKENLNSERKVYLEYSNEVWNSMFSQYHDVFALGENEGYTVDQWHKYYAKRSAFIFQTFENTFGGEERLRKVIGTQAANPWIAGRLLTHFNNPEFNPSSVSADALAIAPYFAGREVVNEIVTNNEIESITVEEIVNRMELSLTKSFDLMAANQIVAEDFGIGLWAYEGGQHLSIVGTKGADNPTLTEKFNQANHHPDLQEVYCKYFNHWYENFGGLFVHFNSHSNYDKYGRWGIKQSMDDYDNPKYMAMQDCVFSYTTMTISCPESQNVSASMLVCGYLVDGSEFDPIIINGPATSIINDFNSSDTLSGELFPIGETIVRWSAFDKSGNEYTCTFSVKVEDSLAPTVTSVADIKATLGPDGTVMLSNPLDVVPAITAADNCEIDYIGIVGGIQSQTFTCENLATNPNIRQVEVRDLSGNSTIIDVKVVVVDVDKPELRVKNISVELDENGIATIASSDLDDGSADVCGSLTLTADRVNFNCEDIGVPILVNVYASDAYGNTSSAISEVTILDRLGPVIENCIDSLAIDLEKNTEFYETPDFWNDSGVTASDNCSGSILTLTQDPIPGTSLSAGLHEITLIAEDINGNVSSCDFQLVISDTSIADNNKPMETLVMYPNPVHEKFHLLNPDELMLESISIYNMLGVLLMTKELRGTDTERIIDVSKLEASSYMVVIKGDGGMRTELMIKE